MTLWKWHKTCKVSKVFGCITGVYLLTILSELRFVKWLSPFWAFFFTSFLWPWDFTRKSGIDKIQIWGFESFIFWSSFLGLFYGVLASVILKVSIIGQSWWPTFLLSPLSYTHACNHKKAFFGQLCSLSPVQMKGKMVLSCLKLKFKSKTLKLTFTTTLF